jgi:hypothetical protein
VEDEVKPTPVVADRVEERIEWPGSETLHGAKITAPACSASGATNGLALSFR